LQAGIGGGSAVVVSVMSFVLRRGGRRKGQDGITPELRAGCRRSR
jgi:hypothetical protein